jgi:hypothetical protein
MMTTYNLEDLVKRLEEILPKLENIQGQTLKSRLDSLKPPIDEESEEEPKVLGKPKGIAIEKVSILGKPKTVDEEVDDEIDKQDIGKKLSSLSPEKDSDVTDEELEELEKSLKRKLKV